MTVNVETWSVQYSPTGSTLGPFAAPFPFFEIDVYLDDVLLSPDVYTIDQDEPGLTGSITFIEDNEPDGTLDIVRNTVRKQQTEYEDNSAFAAKTHERALDRLTMVQQELFAGIPPATIGDVVAASSFGHDNRLIRSDGAGKGVQASPVIVDDDGSMSGIVTLTAAAIIAGTAALTAITDLGSIYFKSGGTNRVAMSVGTQNVLQVSGQGDNKTTSFHLNPGSGVLATDTVAEYVLQRTAGQAFGSDYGRVSFSALGTDQGNIDTLHAEYGGTVVPVRFDFGLGVEATPGNFVSTNYMSLFYASGGSEASQQGAVGFGNDLRTAQCNIVSLLRSSIGSAGQRDSHAVLWEGKANDGTERAVWWRAFNDVTSNAGASTFTFQQNLNGAGWTSKLTLTDGGVLGVTTANATTVNAGVAGTALGSVTVSGNTSGTVSIKPQAAAGTYNFNLPITAGSSGQVLTSAGGVAAPMTWTTLANVATTGAYSDLSGTPSLGALAYLSSVSLTTQVTGILPVANGGTGQGAIGSLSKADDTNVTLTLGGTPTNALLNGVSITAGWTGSLAVGRGGTGITTYAVGDIPYASASTTLSKLAGVATGNALISGGVTTAPSWGKIGLTTHVSGTLAAANGGTGAASYTVGDILYASGTTALSALADVATGNALISGGVGVAPAWGKIALTTHVSGTLPAANGGTGAASYAVGDILYASGTTALSALADVATGNALISGGVTTAPAWGKVGLTTHISGTLAVGNGGTGLTAGTSGGISYFSATNTIASSALLVATAVVTGGGAGAAPATTGVLIDASNNVTGVVALTTTGLFTLTGGQIKFPATQAPSSDVNTLDDYEEGTWTPTWGGFSAAPSGGVARYVKIGKMVYCFVNSWAAGTSNATTKTITLPFNSASADVMAGMGHAFDNGAFSTNPMRIDTRAASATADLYKDINATAWTASGSAVADFAFFYIASA